MKQVIQLEAYQAAALKSERYRTLGLLIVAGSFVLLNCGRVFFIEHTARNIRILIENNAFWVVFGGYELLLLALTNRARRQKRGLRSWVAVLNTVIECLFPTMALLGQTADPGYLGPYLALASGTMIIYCLFIILSTLRLSPGLCVLAGAVSCAGYSSVYALTLWRAPDNPNHAVYRPSVFVMAAILLMVAGLVAAAVAQQIRQHVFAALNEVETRRKLDRIEHDLQIARTIQMGLLPQKPPTVAGYEIAGWSQPADQTGGDYYDWMELPGGRVLFTIADAAGHGIGPALLVAACRAYFRAVASHGDALESITAQVDALLAAEIPAGRFITAAVALLEPEAHKLSLYSAGHAPLYFYRAAADKVEMFDSDQPPLGVHLEDGGSTARVIAMEPGDALVLVTDGFFECMNAAGEQLGMETLGEAIRRHQGLGAGELIERLHADVVAFCKEVPQGDDLTAVVVRRER